MDRAKTGGAGRRQPGDEQAEAANKVFRMPRCWTRGEVLGAKYETVPSSIDPCTYIHRLTDKYTAIRSLVTGTFLCLDTEEYILVIFICTEEYKKLRKIPCFPVVPSFNRDSKTTRYY
jgi:hypothetical protein